MDIRVVLINLVALALAGLASGKVHGVVYEPFADRPELCLGKAEVARQLASIATIADHIRLKALAPCPDSTRQILRFVQRNKMTVMLGLSIRGVPVQDNQEFVILKEMLKTFNETVISHVIVGDELMFDLGLGSRKYIEKAKALVKRTGRRIPVGTAEAWHILEFGSSTSATSRVSDFLCMNMQVYWGGVAANCRDGSSCRNLGALVDQKAEVLAQKFNKPVVICSTGWPTQGEKCCGARTGSLDGFQAVPGLNNTQSFLRDLAAATRTSGRPYYVGDAFDAAWKRTHVPCSDCRGLSRDFGCSAANPRERKCEVAYHFGLFRADGRLKPIAIP